MEDRSNILVLKSLHLAEQLAGNRNFIRCTLAEMLLNIAAGRSNCSNTTVFSLFGLGILDIAVGKFVYDLALREKFGTVIPSFLPVTGLQKGES